MVDLAADLELRLTRVQSAMRAAALDGLVIYYGGQHNMLRMDQIAYLTDYRTLGPAVLAVPREGIPELIMSPVWDAERAEETKARVRVTAVTPDRLLQTGAAVAKTLPGRIGLSGRPVMPIAAYDEFSRAYGGELLDGETIVTTVGATRTPGELERVEHAAKIADQGFDSAARNGARRHARVRAGGRDRGGDARRGRRGQLRLDRCRLAQRRHPAADRPPARRRRRDHRRDHAVLSRLSGATLPHVRARANRPTMQRSTYDMLLAALVDGKTAAKPGRPSAEIARAINGVIGAAGYEEYCKPPYMRTRGHGLGLGGVVPYDITDGAGPMLECNMTMVIHPNQYVPETGYMMCGDTVVIEENGPRALTKTPLKLYWKEA